MEDPGIYIHTFSSADVVKVSSLSMAVHVRFV